MQPNSHLDSDLSSLRTDSPNPEAKAKGLKAKSPNTSPKPKDSINPGASNSPTQKLE